MLTDTRPLNASSQQESEGAHVSRDMKPGKEEALGQCEKSGRTLTLLAGLLS
jgi:hypothetical protein